MSEKSNSLNLSEFFNDDDSEGHRLVEFIKKRRGVTKRQNYLFMNYEPERVSLNVQVQKITAPQVKATVKQLDMESEVQINEPKHKEKDDQLTSVSPERQPTSSAITIQHFNERLPSSPQRSSPRISAIRKSGGGMSPSDRLRRFTLKRLTKLCGGRRTLLQEFENTIESTNFEPPICSTPYSQQQTDEPSLSTNSNQLPNSEQINGESPNINESCCAHTSTLIRTLQRKDKELKDYMESVLDKTLKNIETQSNISKVNTVNENDKSNNTKSPLKRTFTVEKGSIPGQVILTSDKSCEDQVSRHTRLHYSKNTGLKTQEISPRRSLSLRNRKNRGDQTDAEPVSLSNLSSQQKQKKASQYAEKADLEVPKTTKDGNVILIFPTADVEVPPTVELPQSKSNSLIICSGTEQPVVVLPVHGSVTKISDNNVRREVGSNQTDNHPTLKKQQTPPTVEKDNGQILQQAEDNLRLSDILTDDEELTPGLQISQNGSQVPLNLAPKTSKLTKQRFQKRTCSKQKSQGNQSDQLSTEIETDFSPQRMNRRPTTRRAYEPLNRAPGIPLNGEKYAQELTRMSNYEILDLRKRNSMGQIFDIPGRKSRLSLKEVINKRRQLDDQIEKELIKRSLNKAEVTILEIDSGNSERQELCENIPPPPNFLDSLDLQEKNQNFTRESSLIDETPCDRITFKKNETKRRRKKVPELLKQYLEVSKKCKKDSTKSIRNNSKRSLYSQDLYEEDEDDSLAQTLNSTKKSLHSKAKKTSFSFVKSPPKSSSPPITTLKVVSPPPPLSTTTISEGGETSNSENINSEDICLPPPPPGFESDSGISSNNNNYIYQYSTSETLEAAYVNRKTNNHTNSNDDHLFKKPEQPAPKRRARKKKSSNVPQNSTASCQESSSSSADLTESGSLRRSKRGQVKRCVAPIIQLLYEQTWLRSENRKVKNKSLAGKVNSKTNSRQNSKRVRPVQQLEKVNENEETNENLEQTQNVQTPTPPLHHLTSLPSTTPVQTAPRTQTKQLKIRLRRVKPSNSIESAGGSSNSCASRNNSNIELIDWLKNFVNSDDFDPPTEILKEMRISGATNLCFTEIQGLEYAFYDTSEKSSLGYLRFKPQQSKPRKKTKRYHLHYVNLSGIFRITADNSSRLLNVGDMVVIEKYVYYDIKNVSDDIGLLMVVKK